MNGRKSEKGERLHSKCCNCIRNVLARPDTMRSFSLFFFLSVLSHISLMASYTQHHSSTLQYLCACLGLIFALRVRICAKTQPKQNSENMPSICSCTHLDVWLEGGSVLFLLLFCDFGRERMAINVTSRLSLCMDDYLGCIWARWALSELEIDSINQTAGSEPTPQVFWVVHDIFVFRLLLIWPARLELSRSCSNAEVWCVRYIWTNE